VGADAIAYVVTEDADVRGARNPLPAWGGTEPESIERVRQNAPSAFRVQERAVTPEDYATLAQALLYAGARNVVSTFWRISDEGAAAFAEQFYKHLPTLSPSAAVVAVQRQLLAIPRYSSPYYWAAYQVSGGEIVVTQGNDRAAVESRRLEVQPVFGLSATKEPFIASVSFAGVLGTRTGHAVAILGVNTRPHSGGVVLGLMPGGVKALDLRRDPRLALHCPTEDPPENDPNSWLGDAKIAGRAVEVSDPERSDEAHLYQVDIDEVVLTTVEGDQLLIRSWHPGRGLEERRRS
jgi:hypothetical protein